MANQPEIQWFWQPGVRLAVIGPWPGQPMGSPTLEVVGVAPPFLDADAVRVTVWWQQVVQQGLIPWGPAVQVASLDIPLSRVPGATKSMGRATLAGCENWERAQQCSYKMEVLSECSETS